MDFPVEAVCPQWSTLHPGYAANPPIVFNFIEGFGHELSLTGLSLSCFLQLPTVGLCRRFARGFRGHCERKRD